MLTQELRYCQSLNWIFLEELPRDDLADTVNAQPDFGEAGVERSQAQTEVIGFAEVRQHIHLLDQGPIDAVAFRMVQTDMRTAPFRGAGRTKVETERA